jgi:hypothetical protein
MGSSVRRFLKLALGAGCAAVFAQAAFAAPIMRDINTPTNAANHTDDFGTVTLTQESSQEVMVTITFPSGGVHTTGSDRTVFGFNVAGDPTLSITSFSNAAYSAGPSNESVGTTFGAYDYTINCSASACNGGTKTGPDLSFDVSVSTGSLLIASFDKNSKGYYYFTDFLGGSPRQSGITAAFPEAPTFLLFAIPFLGFLFARWKPSQPLRIG